MSKNNLKAKNILLLRNDRFGEFLLNIPAFRALKETFAGARITVAVHPDVKELAQRIPYLNEVIEYGNTHHSFLEIVRMVRMLREKHFELAIMLNPSKEFNLIAYFLGIPVRAGYDRKWSFLLNRKMRDEKYLGLKHEIEYNLELVNLAGARTKDTSLELPIEDDLLNSLFRGQDFSTAENLLAIHPFTSDALKQWPQDNFVKLARSLRDEPGARIIIIGGSEEREKSLELFSNIGQEIINMTGRTTLIQLAVLLKKCRLLVSGDSGPVHLACCVGTPVIALFRNDIPGKSPTRWGPWGEGHIVIHKKSLRDISVEEVIATVKQKLNEKYPSG